jgi:hypothetical protein
MLRAALMILTMALVAACAPEPERSLGPDGKPLPRVYRIRTADENKIQFRMLDAINALRSAIGYEALSSKCFSFVCRKRRKENRAVQ